MKIRLSTFFPFVVLITLSLSCQTVTKAISSEPEDAVQSENQPLAMEWLVTTNELNSFSTEIGILGWTVLQDTPGENRICRSFQGESWSAVPNEGLNCIFKIVEGASLQSVIDSMFNDGQLFAGAELVNSNLNLDGESVLYAGNYPTGHAVFDLILLHGNLMYWSSVTLGTPPGNSPQDVYQSASQVIDAFLVNIINININKSK